MKKEWEIEQERLASKNLPSYPPGSLLHRAARPSATPAAAPTAAATTTHGTAAPLTGQHHSHTRSDASDAVSHHSSSDSTDYEEYVSALDLFITDPDNSEPKTVSRYIRNLRRIVKVIYDGDDDDVAMRYTHVPTMGHPVTSYFSYHGYTEESLKKVEEIYKSAREGQNPRGSFVAMLIAQGMAADTARYIWVLACTPTRA